MSTPIFKGDIGLQGCTTEGQFGNHYHKHCISSSSVDFSSDFRSPPSLCSICCLHYLVLSVPLNMLLSHCIDRKLFDAREEGRGLFTGDSGPTLSHNCQSHSSSLSLLICLQAIGIHFQGPVCLCSLVLWTKRGKWTKARHRTQVYLEINTLSHTNKKELNDYAYLITDITAMEYYNQHGSQRSLSLLAFFCLSILLTMKSKMNYILLLWSRGLGYFNKNMTQWKIYIYSVIYESLLY